MRFGINLNSNRRRFFPLFCPITTRMEQNGFRFLSGSAGARSGFWPSFGCRRRRRRRSPFHVIVKWCGLVLRWCSLMMVWFSVRVLFRHLNINNINNLSVLTLFLQVFDRILVEVRACCIQAEVYALYGKRISVYLFLFLFFFVKLISSTSSRKFGSRRA